MLFEILCLLALVALLLYIRRPSDVPPGPFPLPIVGNLLQLALLNGRSVHLALMSYSKRYGDVMSIRFGSKDFVVLSSFEALKDALVSRDDFNGRPFNQNIAVRSYDKRLGIIFLEGESWKEQRRFALKQMKGLGFGKQCAMDVIIREELWEVISRIQAQMGDGVHAVLHMHNYFNLSILNILWCMIAGDRFSHDDPVLNDLLQRVDYLMKSGSIGGLASAFPIIKRLFPGLSGEHGQAEVYKRLQSFIKDSIDEHRRRKSFGDSADFIDIYLNEIDKGGGLLFTEQQLIMICLDFFFAGSETTSVTLGFSLLYMMLYPKVQEKVYQEILRIVGPNRNPKLDDRESLVYTQAVIMEVQRMSNVVPITPPHHNSTQTKLRDFRIPQDSIIFINLYAIHMSKEVWGDPEIFRPERFLGENGELRREEKFIPFGIGKRICLGETLARSSLFLYFATLVQKFSFSTVPGLMNPSTEPTIGFTFSPKPYDCLITNRNKPARETGP